MADKRIDGVRRSLEYKDDSGVTPVTKEDIKQVELAVKELRDTQDSRLLEIAKKGAADILSEEKLARINQTLDAYEGQNQKLVQAEAKLKALDEMKATLDQLETTIARAHKDANPEAKTHRTEDWARAVVSAHLMGIPNLDENQRKALQDVQAEYKALSISPDTAGGYLAPVEYVREIIKGVTEMSPVRSLARVRTTAMKSVEIPKRTGQFAAQWVSAQGTKSETTGLTYGLHEIPTHEFYALIDISNQMMEDSAFSMQAEISEEATEQFAVAEGTAFVTGNGVGKPEGFMSNASVAETVSGSATTIADADGQANGLLTLKYGIKSAYAANASWVMNRSTMGAVRILKDADKNYIWQSGLAAGRPNTIDGDPYVELPDMPSQGAGLYPIAYGDFRRAYTWVDRISMEMLRDPYTQATAGNVRFIMRKRVGGQVVLAEAIRKLKCST